MRENVKKCILAYNIFALPFVPLTLYVYTPQNTIFSKIFRFFTGWLNLLAAGLAMPLQEYLIPQIIAVVLIGLYLFDLIRNRHIHPIRGEIPAFLKLSAWTLLSGLCILLGCIAMLDGVGKPLS